MKTVWHKIISIILLFIVSAVLIGIFSSCALTEEKSTLEYDFKLPSQSGKSAEIINESQNKEPQTVEISQTDSVEVTEKEISEPITYLSPIKGLEELSPSLVKKINDAWSAKYGYEYKGDVLIDLDYINTYYSNDRYLGTIDGFVVVLRSGPLAAETKKIIGGYDFFWGSAFTLVLYKNGVFLTLEEAYANGTVNIEFVKTVYLRNNEYTRFFNPDTMIIDKLPLSDDELAKINDDWQREIGNGEIFIESNDEFSSHGTVFYFGNYNSCYILMKKMSNERGWVTIDIAGQHILIYNEDLLVAYKDGTFYSLQEAYDNNLLTDIDIKLIAYEISIC